MKLILYSTGCPKCAVLKKKLDEKNIEYNICDNVSTMTNLGISAIPVLSIDDKLYEFNEAVKWINNYNEG